MNACKRPETKTVKRGDLDRCTEKRLNGLRIDKDDLRRYPEEVPNDRRGYPPCVPAERVYTDPRGVRNLVDGHRSVISGIFVCTPAWIPPMVGGARNTQYSPPSQRGSQPPTALPRATSQFEKR